MDQFLDIAGQVLGSGVVVAIVTGITGLIAKIGLNRRWLPLAAVVVGVGFVGSVLGFSVINAWIGVLAGLASSGLYDVGKKTVLGK